MDYEKAYKEALERMKGYVKDEYGCTRLRPEDIFTELAESEDERVRKAIIDVLKAVYECADMPFISQKQTLDSYVAWVEKQGKQKPVEWSEEDQAHIDSILQRLEGMCQKGATFTRTRFAVSEDEDWLKSLRPQKQWKPTEDNIDQAISILEKAAKDIKIPEKYKTSDWLCEKEDDLIENLHRQLRDNILRAKEEAKNKI